MKINTNKLITLVSIIILIAVIANISYEAFFNTGALVTLYEHTDYTGQSYSLNSIGVHDITGAFGNRASSIKIKTCYTAFFYFNDNDYITLSPGNYPNLTQHLSNLNRQNVNDRIIKVDIKKLNDSCEDQQNELQNRLNKYGLSPVVDNPVSNNQQYYYANFIPNGININSPTVTYSVSFWVKQTNINGGWRNLVYFGFGDDSARNPDRTPGIWIYPGNRSLHYRHRSSTNWNDGADIDEQHIPQMGTWYHVLYTVNNNVINGYIDGTLRTSITIGGRFIWHRRDKHMRIFSTEWGWPLGGLEIQKLYFIPYVVPQTTTDPNRVSIELLYQDPRVIRT